MLELLESLMVLCCDTHENPASLIIDFLTLHALENLFDQRFFLILSLRVLQCLPVILLMLFYVFFITYTVWVYHVSALELEQKSLIVIENHLLVDEVPLIVLDKLHYVQISCQLFLALLKKFVVLLGDLVSF